MSKKPRRKFSEELKREIIESYTTGTRTAAELAHEHGIAVGLIYRWKSELGMQIKNNRIDELTEAGATRAMAIKIQQQEEEIQAYQNLVAQQAVIIDLLKKLQPSTNYQPESELTGLIGMVKKSDRKPKPVK